MLCLAIFEHDQRIFAISLQQLLKGMYSPFESTEWQRRLTNTLYNNTKNAIIIWKTTTDEAWNHFYFLWRLDSIPGHALPLRGLAITLSHTSLSRILWMSDQPDADTSNWHHTTLTKERHPLPIRDSNPQSQEAIARTLTP